MEERNDIFGLVGRRLGHSRSAEMFNAKFKAEGINAQYLNFEIDSASELPNVIAKHTNLKGLNVTVPFKSDVIPLLDRVDPMAAEAGAVNVIRIDRNNPAGTPILFGYNSDIYGFTESVRPIITDDVKCALVLGTGGASKAVAAGLNSLGVKVLFVSRRPAAGQLAYTDLTDDVMDSALLVVNTTPLGMWPDTESAPPIPYHLVTDRHVCFDCVYNPGITRFMHLCAERGATVKNGLEMLRLQAVRAWQLWTSPTP